MLKVRIVVANAPSCSRFLAEVLVRWMAARREVLMLRHESVCEERGRTLSQFSRTIIFLALSTQGNLSVSYPPALMRPMGGNTNLGCTRLPPPAMAIYWTGTPLVYAFVVLNILTQSLVRRIRRNRASVPTFYAMSTLEMKSVSQVQWERRCCFPKIQQKM